MCARRGAASHLPTRSKRNLFVTSPMSPQMPLLMPRPLVAGLPCGMQSQHLPQPLCAQSPVTREAPACLQGPVEGSRLRGFRLCFRPRPPRGASLSRTLLAVSLVSRGACGPLSLSGFPPGDKRPLVTSNMVMHTCNSSTQGAEAGAPVFELSSSLGYEIRLYLLKSISKVKK